MPMHHPEHYQMTWIEKYSKVKNMYEPHPFDKLDKIVAFVPLPL